jgi:hypothetical protein
MNRAVMPELLDILPPQDPAALRSRRDLRRLNAWMAHPQIMARAVQTHWLANESPQIVELGAGDGHFLSRVASRLNGHWPHAHAILVDRLDLVDWQTREKFNRLGWSIQTQIAEATEWLNGIRRNDAPGRGQLVPESSNSNSQGLRGRAIPAPVDGERLIVVTNLFLHQFREEQLAEMLRLAARSARLVIALEPRRSWFPKLCGRLLWVIGCGPVTRHDARISIRAGFLGRELSALWPDQKSWTLIEKPAGLFSHLFVAGRKD